MYVFVGSRNGIGCVDAHTGIKERGQPATSPIVEEINLGHVETGWSVRVRNRMVRVLLPESHPANFDCAQGITW